MASLQLLFQKFNELDFGRLAKRKGLWIDYLKLVTISLKHGLKICAFNKLGLVNQTNLDMFIREQLNKKNMLLLQNLNVPTLK